MTDTITATMTISKAVPVDVAVVVLAAICPEEECHAILLKKKQKKTSVLLSVHVCGHT